MIRDKCAAAPQRFRRSGRCVFRGLQLELSINFGPDQHDVEGEIKPKQKNDHSA
jgi:hypothetical protein